MEFLRDNRCLVVVTALLLALGMAIYDAFESAEVWFWLVSLSAQLGAMRVDHRRKMRSLRMAYERRWGEVPNF